MAFNNQRFFFIGILAIIILTSAVYFNTLNGFFLSDDFVNLHTDNPPTSLSDCMQRFIPMRSDITYRPLWNFSWYLDHKFWGDSPLGYHITNTALHILVSVLVFLLAYAMTKKKWPSLFAGILFALHPIHSEPVVWISGRMESICACFYLLSLIAMASFLDLRRLTLYFASLLAFLASLLTKEMALSLPLLIFISILIKDSTHPFKKNILRAVKLSSPFFLISLGYVVFRIMFYGRIGIRMAGGHCELSQFFLERGIIKSISSFLMNVTYFPFLNFFFPFDDSDFGGYSFFIKIVSTLIFIIPFLFILRSGIKKLFNKWIIYGLAFIPLSSIPLFYTIGSRGGCDRYLYLPSVGYCLVIAFMLWLFFEKIKLTNQARFIYCGLVIILNIVILAVNNNFRNIAAEIAYQIPFQAYKKYPDFKVANPILYLYGDISSYKGICLYAFMIQRAFRMFYLDHSPSVYVIWKDRFGFDTGIGYECDTSTDFDLRYGCTDNGYLMRWDGINKKLIDLTDAFKLALKEGFIRAGHTVYPIWQREEIDDLWKLETSSSKIHFSSPEIKIPLVRARSIQIRLRIKSVDKAGPVRGEIAWFADQDAAGDPGNHYLFALETDGETHRYTFPVKIVDIEQLDANIVRLEFKLPFPRDLINIESIEITPFREFKEIIFPVWNFKNDGNLWSGEKVASEYAPCLFKAPLTITSPRLDIPMKEIKSVRLKMRIPAEKGLSSYKGKLAWITDADKNWEEQNKYLSFDMIPDAEFHIYEILFDSVNLEQDNAKLVQIRLLLNSLPAEAEIESIELISV